MSDDMLTNFAHLYNARPRETEHSDARLGIRHHDPDQEKRKNQNEEKKSPSLFNEEDYAVVSVEALRLFLKNFIGALEPQAPAPPASEDSLQTPKSLQGKAAHAAHAYAHASETKSSNRFQETPAPSAPPRASNANLSSEEIHMIHSLLENLKILSERNVEHIRIERGESFLQSLADAVNKALGL